jgi:hypothetical protein
MRNFYFYKSLLFIKGGDSQMNFIALIGIVTRINLEKKAKYAQLSIKVEKPYVNTINDNRFETIDVNLDTLIFKKEIKNISKDDIVGIKGRLSKEQDNKSGQIVIGERLQIF